MIKFLCPRLNNLQTFNEGTATHTVSRSVHTFASMAYISAAVVHPPISGSAVGNDGMQTLSFTTPDAKIKWCVVRGRGRPSNWTASLSQSISVKICDPDIPSEPHYENAKALRLVGLACHSFKIGMRNSSNMYRYTTPVKGAISKKVNLRLPLVGYLQSLQADYYSTTG